MTIETTAPADTAEKSLREELQEAFDAASASVDAGKGGEGVVDDGGAAASTAAASAEQRARDAQGRFAGKTDAEDAKVVDRTGQGQGAAQAAQGTAPAAGDQAQAAAAAAAAAAAIAAPGNLKPELRAAWDAAPAELRKWISDREAEVHKGFTRMDEERQFAKTMRETIAPYSAMIQAEGGDAPGAVKALLNTAYILRAGSPQQKVMALQSIATQYGITPEHVQQAQRMQGQPVDPRIANLEQQIQQLTQSRQQEEQQRVQQFQTQIQTEIAAFAASPGHEHYEQVKPHMAALLKAELAKDMQDAYDQAVWARPDLRQQVLAAQQQTAQQAQVTQAQARAAAAKRAAGSVAGSPGTSIPVSAPDRSLRDEIRANLRAASH